MTDEWILRAVPRRFCPEHRVDRHRQASLCSVGCVIDFATLRAADDEHVKVMRGRALLQLKKARRPGAEYKDTSGTVEVRELFGYDLAGTPGKEQQFCEGADEAVVRVRPDERRPSHLASPQQLRIREPSHLAVNCAQRCVESACQISEADLLILVKQQCCENVCLEP